ncbi:MAG: bifunctional hydroxymethylpyrimidine kinase/phosphomethylpyrimidine kinase, partial [Actinomycetota bacterium]
ADGRVDHLESPWVDTPHVRGSGCTFAAATAAGLGAGLGPADAISRAKAFVTGRLRESTWDGLKGAGPVSHRIGDA